MPVQRLIERILVKYDAAGLPNRIEVITQVSILNPDNPDMMIQNQESVVMAYADMPTGEQTALRNLLKNAATPMVNRERPLVKP